MSYATLWLPAIVYLMDIPTGRQREAKGGRGRQREAEGGRGRLRETEELSNCGFL